MIDLTGLDKAAVLAALYNGSRPLGMGLFRSRLGDMSIEEARGYLNNPKLVPDYVLANEYGCFDYLNGRPLKINISGDTLDPWGYDRDNGEGAAARIIANLRLEASR